jgi:RNA polymerase sigma factor (sigma-70 family)
LRYDGAAVPPDDFHFALPGASVTQRTRTASSIRDDTPDAELVPLCIDGDERAWATLVRRYRRLVYAVPSRAGLEADEVEEVFHQTFARLAERIGSIRDPARVRAWLVTTARRLTIDTIRRRRQSAELSDSEETLGRLPSGDPLPSDALEEIENQHQVRQALLRLGPRCRRLLTSLFYHSSDQPPSYESVSQELGIPIGSIGPTRARCLQQLLTEFTKLEEK